MTAPDTNDATDHSAAAADAALRADMERRIEAIHARWDDDPGSLMDLCDSVRRDALTLGDHVIAIDMSRRLAVIVDDERAATLLGDALPLSAVRHQLDPDDTANQQLRA